MPASSLHTASDHAARALLDDARTPLRTLTGDLELLALLRDPPEELQVILPALRAAKAILDGRDTETVLRALAEDADVYLLAPFGGEYDTCPALAADTLAQRRTTTPAERDALILGLRRLCDAHLALLSARDGHLIDGFTHGARRTPVPAGLTGEQLTARLRAR